MKLKCPTLKLRLCLTGKVIVTNYLLLPYTNKASLVAV
jgi:hypothetical protein